MDGKNPIANCCPFLLPSLAVCNKVLVAVEDATHPGDELGGGFPLKLLRLVQSTVRSEAVLTENHISLKAI
jgi:hypothetical protein